MVGSALGLALGDALGAPYEFLRSNNVPDPIPALERPWMHLPPGSTTDDTALARNLMRSLAERGGLDLDELLRRHLEWLRSDPPDVGSLTGRVLRLVERGEDAATVAREVWEQRGPEVSAGNGSVMYCAPLGLAYANRPRELPELAPALSALTHYDGRCRTAVLAVTLVVAALVRGEPAEAAVEAALAVVGDRDGGEELEFLIGAIGRSRPIDGPDQGFCLFTAGSPSRRCSGAATPRASCGASSGSAGTPTRTGPWRARCSALGTGWRGSPRAGSSGSRAATRSAPRPRRSSRSPPP